MLWENGAGDTLQKGAWGKVDGTTEKREKGSGEPPLPHR